MNKKIAALAAGAAILLYAVPAFAGNPKSPADYNGLNRGKSDIQHLYLYEKDPSDWSIVEDGAWGKMSFDSESFVFNGHGLLPNTEYTLIVYDTGDNPSENEWPGEGPRLATGTTNKGGNLNLSGNLLCLDEAKIWLVLSSDADADGVMTAWNPTEYLFEYNRVSTDCADLPPTL